MAEDTKEDGIVTVLSVIGFVFGLIAMLGSFIPCLGSLAFFLGIPAAIVSGIAIMIANSKKVKKTFATAALTISLIGVVVSGIQYFSIMGAGNVMMQEMEKATQQVRQRQQNPS